METLNLGSKCADVNLLCKFLGVPEKDTFDNDLDAEVKKYQGSNGLKVDGLVGYNTWKSLITENRPEGIKLTDWDYTYIAKLMNIEPACLKAVKYVETGGGDGFLSNGKPRILFEGHIFWRELKLAGIDPTKYGSAWSNVLYPKWDRSKYRGGVAEWDRLEQAKKISEEAAVKSASWGMFQIMGFNHKSCGCENVFKFVEELSKDEFQQLLQFVELIKRNPMLYSYLKNKDWARFAKCYNGPEYAKNKYDARLEDAYRRITEGRNLL